MNVAEHSHAFRSNFDSKMSFSSHINKRSGYLAGHRLRVLNLFSRSLYRFGLRLKGPIRISSRLHWVGSIRNSSRLHWVGSIRISSRLHWVGSIRISSRLHWEGLIRISSRLHWTIRLGLGSD